MSARGPITVCLLPFASRTRTASCFSLFAHVRTLRFSTRELRRVTTLFCNLGFDNAELRQVSFVVEVDLDGPASQEDMTRIAKNIVEEATSYFEFSET